MPSLVSGYNYDIFISYRQKDNKHDGWVTEFVKNLKGELESTFKEEISVYFDVNPHDGLLETHDVDASLKEKLNCLIFIPIISRTYCDPRSFAWEHEFKAFVEMASKDQFGLKVKLPNGNVASRVLPVRIHDLDAGDIKEYEALLGGILRGIDFIYREPGVNRPLAAGDSDQGNIIRINYRNQLNKVANTVKDIINGLNNSLPLSEQTDELSILNKKTSNKKRQNFFNGRYLILSALILITLASLVYKGFNRNESVEKLKTSQNKLAIVVLPFQNLTNDPGKNFWQTAIQENITSYLSNLQNDLIIRQPAIVNELIQSRIEEDYSSMSLAAARTISGKMNVNMFVTGNFQHSGHKVYASAKLLDAQTFRVMKPFEIEVENGEESLRELSDSLRRRIADFLVISKLANGMTPDYQYMTTTSPDAYNFYIEGEKAFMKADFKSAEKNYSLAISIDSGYLDALLGLSVLYRGFNRFDEATKFYNIAFRNNYSLAPIDRHKLNEVHAMIYESPEEVIKYAKQILEIDDQFLAMYLDIADCYLLLEENEKAIQFLEKGLKIFTQSSSRHIWGEIIFCVLGDAYHKTHQYQKEKNLYLKAEKTLPPDFRLTGRQLRLALSKGETAEAEKYLEKFRRTVPSFMNEGDVSVKLALYYAGAGKLDEAEDHFRNACRYKPEDPDYLYGLAFFLIDTKRGVNEGLRIIDKILASDPDNSRYLDTKGWGFYRQGKYIDALSVLQKADSLKPVYLIELAQHLDTVRKAAAGLN